MSRLSRYSKLKILKPDPNSDVKELAGFFHQVKQLFSFCRKNWKIVLFLGSLFTSAAGTVMHTYYGRVIEPKATEFVYVRTDQFMTDSLGVKVDRHMRTKGGGFRGALAEHVGISKDDVVAAVGNIILKEDSFKRATAKIRVGLMYARAIGNLLISEMFKDTINRGVKLKIAPSGDIYYLDSLKIPWAAQLKYRPLPVRWAYYPPYNNNERTDCK